MPDDRTAKCRKTSSGIVSAMEAIRERRNVRVLPYLNRYCP
jgi:hypothetical protein